jgi:circadian clock protein KaiC
LDEVLKGGVPTKRLLLIEGDPGSGKTTLGLQFLLEGKRCGETGLYVSLSESREEIISVAESHGWSLDGIRIFELPAPEEALSPQAHYTMFHSAEVELTPVLKNVLDVVERIKPTRVVFDSLSEMRLLSRDSLKFRRQILALKQFFAGRNNTVFLLEDRVHLDKSGSELQSLCHGVIQLEQFMGDYGAKRRRLNVCKMRGTDFRSGYHDFDIKTGGIVVFPRLIASGHFKETAQDVVKSGVSKLDELLGGGLERGTSSLILGAAGTGKTSLAMQYATALARRGERSAVYTFDEVLPTLLKRTERLGMNLRDFAAQGRIQLNQIDLAELAPGEFIEAVRYGVENEDVRAVVIDSLNGYLNSMSQERFLMAQMHELFSYLNQKGILTLLIVSQHGLLGSGVESPVDLSYLSDTVILLRYFESQGLVRKAISVVKKRSSEHEHTIREFQLTEDGFELGEPLREFQGILTGTPAYRGGYDPLLRTASESIDCR